jgi:pyruvate/2-oxoglutarate dehydrogenase complex dihydrolipoamide dehydrogenase (E3) component
MKKETDVLVVGGGPAGIISAVTARKYYPNKKISLIKSIEKGVIPCGIPYMFASLKNPEENKLGNAALEKNNVEVFVDEAVQIERKEKVVTTKNKDTYHYEKLILAVGSNPIVPPIPGIDKKGIYPVYKEMDYLKDAVKTFKKAKNVLVLGGGFIGVEFADELAKIDGHNVYLVEMLPDLLANSFDSEFSQLVEEKLKAMY